MKGKHERDKWWQELRKNLAYILSDSGYSSEILRSKTESTVTEETKPTFRQEQ